MATPIPSAEIRDQALTQIMAVAAVLAAFPVTALSGVLTNRFKTAHDLLVVTPANRQITDEQGDLLEIFFLTAAPYAYVRTQKGQARVELEAGRSQGY
jgi:hypothetical protein